MWKQGDWGQGRKRCPWVSLDIQHVWWRRWTEDCCSSSGLHQIQTSQKKPCKLAASACVCHSHCTCHLMWGSHGEWHDAQKKPWPPPSFSNFESTSKCFLNNAFPSISISLSFRTRYKVRTAQCRFPSKANSPMRVGTWLHSSLYQGCSHLIDCRSLPSIWSIGSSTKLIGYYPVRLRAHMTKMAGLTPASLCFCTERNSIHAHCPCQECHGKTVNYKTRERHLSALRLLQQENSEFTLLLNV